MKLNPFCMCCAINKQEKKIRQFDDVEKKNRYMQKVMERFVNSRPDDCAPSISVDLKKLFREYWNQPVEDFTSIKQHFNQLMLELEDSIEKEVRISPDPLEAALIYARIGNYIDFAALPDVDPQVVRDLIHSEDKSPLDPSEYAYFKRDLSSASRLVYLTDNCGEIVLDKLVIRILKEQYPSLDITVLVRGLPVVNDATLTDARETGLDGIVRVVGNGSGVGGTWLPGISEEARQYLENADLILSKGQGNYETLHDCGLNIYYLFLCKCEWFQILFKVPPLHPMFLNEKRILTD